MSKYTGGYQHFVPAVPLVNTNNLQRHLVTTFDDFVKVLDEHPVDKFKYIAYDTETTGLDATVHHIVGFSIAFNGTEGYYIPIRHIKGHQVERDKINDVFNLLYKRFKESKCVFMYNARFDMRMTQKEEGFGTFEDINYYDVAVGCWYADSNIPQPGLKWSAEHFLGRKPDHFEETLGSEANFAYLDPVNGYSYAADDALNTFALAMVTSKYYKEGGMAAQLDNKILYPLMIFEDNGINVDIPFLEEKLQVLIPLLEKYESNIHKGLGQEINIRSGKQVAEALESLGITTGKYTAKGAMKTDMESLEETYKRYKAMGEEYDFLTAMVKYSALNKLIGSYFQSLHDEAVRMGGKCRFSYLTTRVPTGRLACGSDKKNTFFAHLNVQAIPKPHPLDYYVFHKKDFEKQYEYRGNELVLFDWIMVPTNEENPRKSMYITEGFDQSDNIRSAFKPDDNCLWVSIDYSAQELRVPGLLMGRGVWHDAFMRGEDVHKAVAESIWGKENYDKSKRKLAKAFSFSLQYGGTRFALMPDVTTDEEEAQRYVDLFEDSMKDLRAWQNKHLQTAMRTGTVYSYFGFPRRVESYLNSPDTGRRSFGRRTVSNHLVQSTSAQITKIAILKLWKRLLNPKLNTGCRFMNTIHDEVNMSIPYNPENPKEFWDKLNTFKECMVLRLPNWDYDLDVGIGIGVAQGHTVDWSYEPESEWATELNGGWHPKWDIVPITKEEPKVEEKPEEVPASIDIPDSNKGELYDGLFEW